MNVLGAVLGWAVSLLGRLLGWGQPSTASPTPPTTESVPPPATHQMPAAIPVSGTAEAPVLPGEQFRVAWAGACQRAGLPGGLRVYARKSGKDVGRTDERFAPDHVRYVMRHTWASWHYAINTDLMLLKRDGAWETTDVLQVYVHLMPAAYVQEAKDWLAGGRRFPVRGTGTDRRFRAVAEQSGRTIPLGRPPRK